MQLLSGIRQARNVNSQIWYSQQYVHADVLLHSCIKYIQCTMSKEEKQKKIGSPVSLDLLWHEVVGGAISESYLWIVLYRSSLLKEADNSHWRHVLYGPIQPAIIWNRLSYLQETGQFKNKINQDWRRREKAGPEQSAEWKKGLAHVSCYRDGYKCMSNCTRWLNYTRPDFESVPSEIGTPLYNIYYYTYCLYFFLLAFCFIPFHLILFRFFFCVGHLLCCSRAVHFPPSCPSLPKLNKH